SEDEGPSMPRCSRLPKQEREKVMARSSLEKIRGDEMGEPTAYGTLLSSSPSFLSGFLLGSEKEDGAGRTPPVSAIVTSWSLSPSGRWQSYRCRSCTSNSRMS